GYGHRPSGCACTHPTPILRPGSRYPKGLPRDDRAQRQPSPHQAWWLSPDAPRPRVGKYAEMMPELQDRRRSPARRALEIPPIGGGGRLSCFLILSCRRWGGKGLVSQGKLSPFLPIPGKVRKTCREYDSFRELMLRGLRPKPSSLATRSVIFYTRLS